jgi:hypothetical protein
MSFDFRQSFDRCSARSPCREEGEVAVADLAADQKPARPCLTVTGRFGPPYGKDVPGVNFVVTDIVMYVFSGVIYAAGGIVGR